MSVCGGVILHKVTKKGLHNNFEICQKLVGWLWHKTNVLLELTQIFEILRQKMHILLFTKFGYQQVLFIRQIKHNGTKTWVMDTCCGIANTCIFCSQTPSPFNDETAICQIYCTFVIELYLLWLLSKLNYSSICIMCNNVHA